MNPLDKLLAWQPTAIDVRLTGTCGNCKRHTELFYVTPGYPAEIVGDWIHGGCYCPQCGFGGSCAIPLDVYENAEILKGADE